MAASISWRIDHLHEFVFRLNLGIKRQPVARFLRFRFDVPWVREMLKRTGWGREFDDPIELPDGRTLVTLEDRRLHHCPADAPRGSVLPGPSGAQRGR